MKRPAVRNPEPRTPSAETLFSPLVERAIELAAEWHEGTYRKGRWRDEPFAAPPTEALHIPMMAHVTAVALTVQRAGWDDAVVAAAFLHDVLEDANRYRQGMAPGQLAALVGGDVTDIVRAVTEPKFDGDGSPLPWRVRKETYLDLLAAGPPGATAISLADKLHNVWTMSESLANGVDIFTSAPNRRALSAGPGAQRWFFRAVLDASHRHTDPRLAPMRARLEDEIGRFEALTRLEPADYA